MTGTDADLRDLLLKEAEWVKDDIDQEKSLLVKYWAGYISLVYLLIGWMLTRVVPELQSASKFDETFSALRQRADIVIAISAIPALNALVTVLSLAVTARLLALTQHLQNLGRQLGGEEVWRWPAQAFMHPYVLFTTLGTALLQILLMIAITVGALWFAWPGAKQSWTLLTWWLVGPVAWVLIVAMAVTIAVLTVRRSS